MPPKKKAAGGGDAAKGEKIFKNLCSACHSMSVSRIHVDIEALVTIWLFAYFRLTQLDLLSVVSVETTSLLDKVSTIPQHLRLRPPWSGLMVTLTSGLSSRQVSHLVTPWPSPVLVAQRTAQIWSPTSREVEHTSDPRSQFLLLR